MDQKRFRPFSMRLPEDIYRRLRTVSRREHRSLGPQIVKILEEKLPELEAEEATDRAIAARTGGRKGAA